MTRRELLKLASGLGAAAISGPWSGRATGITEQPPASPALRGALRDIAAARGLRFGAAVAWEELASYPAYADLVAQQCGILVPEIELKWKALRSTPEEFDFRRADRLYAFAASHGMLFRGHTLIWEQALPKWFTSVVNAQNAKSVMVQHISTVVAHFAGKIHSWDVVNEAIQLEDGRPDGLKVTPWLRFLGPEYIEMAFHTAHAADPNAMLVLNENWIEPENSAAERRRQAVLALLTQLKRKRVPVHALGVQSHISAEMQTTGPRFRRFLQAIEDLGLTIMITEMDVRDQRLPGNVAERDRLVAKQYQDYLSLMLQFMPLKAIMTWGLTDRFTWLAKAHPRPDGLAVRPLPYDTDLNPKPSWGAIRHALEIAPRRGLAA
jgi:endo-1,4-beta-xylanase